MTKVTGSEVILQVVYHEVKSQCICQANQIGHEKVGGTINYMLQLKSYVFEQVIFVLWIKFFSFEKKKFILKSDWNMDLISILIYIGKCIFQ